MGNIRYIPVFLRVCHKGHRCNGAYCARSGNNPNRGLFIAQHVFYPRFYAGFTESKRTGGKYSARIAAIDKGV